MVPISCISVTTDAQIVVKMIIFYLIHPTVMHTVMDCTHTSTSLWFVCLLSPFITVTLAVDMSCLLVQLGENKVVCGICGCIEVHSATLYCSVNGSKATALISSLAHRHGCFL